MVASITFGLTGTAVTLLGLIKLVEMLAALSQDPALLQLAKEVAASTIRMPDAAK